MNAKSRIAAGALAFAVLTGGALYGATPAHAGYAGKVKTSYSAIYNISTRSECLAVNKVMLQTIYSLGMTPLRFKCYYTTKYRWTSYVYYGTWRT